MGARPAPPSFERVADFSALVRAARRAAKNKPMSNDCARFLLDIERECLALRDELLAGVYWPRPFRTFCIRDPKPRTISAAAFRDRVVHHALCTEVVPVLEYDALPVSFACRVGGGQLRALRACQSLVQRHRYVLMLDIEHFFETLHHVTLERLLAPRLAHDPPLIHLASTFIQAGAPGSDEGRGVPIGNLTSQHFANFYLGPLDRCIVRGLGLPLVRYMDDLRAFSDSAEQLWAAESRIRTFVETRLQVRVKSRLTRVMPVTEGVPFLGFRIYGAMCPFDNARRRRYVRRLREMMGAEHRGGDERALQASATSLRGWGLHGTTGSLTRSVVQRWLAASEDEGTTGSNRGNRGGSWNNSASNLRSANRNNNEPTNRNNNVGLRLASTGSDGAVAPAGVAVVTAAASVHDSRSFFPRPVPGSGGLNR
jgi:RNA-directed DNA polymerase